MHETHHELAKYCRIAMDEAQRIQRGQHDVLRVTAAGIDDSLLPNEYIKRLHIDKLYALMRLKDIHQQIHQKRLERDLLKRTVLQQSEKAAVQHGNHGDKSTQENVWKPYT